MAGEEGHEERLEMLLEGILAEKRRGGTPDLASLTAKHPEFAEELKELLPAMDLLVKGGGAPSDSPAPSVNDEPECSLPERLASRFGPEVDPKIVLEGKRERSAAFVTKALAQLAGHQGRYEFRSEIGRGGQGAVLAVWDGDLRRNLAMKVLLERRTKGSSGHEPRTVGRFLEEAQITAQLDHPGIVPVHELGLDSEARIYFTMKLVKGRDLRAVFELVERGDEGWTRTRALNVLLKACEAMAYAHAKGVIHRDLKPSNVMVGRYGEVYVMDWGLARVLGREDGKDIRIRPALASSELRTERLDASLDLDSPLITMQGDVVGTPAYMSPEQARGDLAAMGPQSDVYSLGAMLYHLLAGQMPFERSDSRLTNHAIWELVQRGPPESLQALASSAPPELVAICERAMAREPGDRYADMSALAEDLRAFLENRVVSAHRTGALVELRKWVARNRGLAAVSAAAILLTLGGLAAVSYVQARGKRAADAQRANVMRLSALQELKDLKKLADELWPPWPEYADDRRCMLKTGGLRSRTKQVSCSSSSREAPS
jgi:serine/threonine-protein kinase